MSQHHKSTRRMNLLRREFHASSKAASTPCWLCGMAIDYDSPSDDFQNESRFELDHYLPVSTHPRYAEDPANFRASHSGCNRQRGNKAPTAPLGMLSRDWVTG